MTLGGSRAILDKSKSGSKNTPMDQYQTQMTIPHRASAMTHHKDFDGIKTLSSQHASSNETLINVAKNVNMTERVKVNGAHGRNFASTSPKLHSMMDSMSNATSMTAR